MNASLFRLRCAYPKSDRLSFLGHLELISTVERSVRRAGLPFAVSNGFARRMRIQFSSALPVGVSSLAEYFDLFLTERLDEYDALATIAAYSPAPLRPVRARYMPSSLPALEAWLDRSSWTLDLGPSIDGALAEPSMYPRGTSRMRSRKGREAFRSLSRRSRRPAVRCVPRPS